MQYPIGIVVYAIGTKPGTLTAEWAASDNQSGVICKGEAIGGAGEGFVGRYVITYENESEKPCEPLDLTVSKVGEIYHLVWARDGKPNGQGVGMISDDKLVVGWQ